jgi:hypothetical protein
METVRKRGKIPTKDEKATFFSDGNDQYTKAIIKNFDVETINYGTDNSSKKGKRAE